MSLNVGFWILACLNLVQTIALVWSYQLWKAENTLKNAYQKAAADEIRRQIYHYKGSERPGGKEQFIPLKPCPACFEMGKWTGIYYWCNRCQKKFGG